MTDKKLLELPERTPADSDNAYGVNGTTVDYRWTFAGLRSFLSAFFATDAELDAHTSAPNPHSNSASQTDLTNHTGAANPHSGSAASTTTITGANSIEGGGSLAANRVMALVNDANNPGGNQVYGTDGAGVKGWKPDPAGGSGEANTQTNQGGGAELGLPKNGVDLPIRTLVSGDSSINIVPVGDTLDLRSVGVGSGTVKGSPFTLGHIVTVQNETDPGTINTVFDAADVARLNESNVFQRAQTIQTGTTFFARLDLIQTGTSASSVRMQNSGSPVGSKAMEYVLALDGSIVLRRLDENDLGVVTAVVMDVETNNNVDFPSGTLSEQGQRVYSPNNQGQIAFKDQLNTFGPAQTFQSPIDYSAFLLDGDNATGPTFGRGEWKSYATDPNGSAQAGSVGASLSFTLIEDQGLVMPDESKFLEGHKIAFIQGDQNPTKRATGGRHAAAVSFEFKQPTAAGNANPNYVGHYVDAFATSGDNGTDVSAGARGGFFGRGVYARANSGATNWFAIVGDEINMAIQTGASARFLWGSTAVVHAEHAVDTPAGGLSAAYHVGAQAGANQIDVGFHIGDENGQQPIKPGGHYFKAPNFEVGEGGEIRQNGNDIVYQADTVRSGAAVTLPDLLSAPGVTQRVVIDSTGSVTVSPPANGVGDMVVQFSGAPTVTLSGTWTSTTDQGSGSNLNRHAYVSRRDDGTTHWVWGPFVQ